MVSPKPEIKFQRTGNQGLIAHVTIHLVAEDDVLLIARRQAEFSAVRNNDLTKVVVPLII